MTAPRAWRFAAASADRRAGGVGGIVLEPSGRIALTAGDDAVRQALLLLLSTIPGERVMRPTYGSYLHRLVFSPNDATTAGLAIHYVRQAVERWEHRVEVVDVDAEPSADDGVLDVRLTYRVRATHTQAAIELAVDVAGRAPRPVTVRGAH